MGWNVTFYSVGSSFRTDKGPHTLNMAGMTYTIQINENHVMRFYMKIFHVFR